MKNVALNRLQNGGLAIVETEHEIKRDSVRILGARAHTHTHTSLLVFLFLVHRKQASFCVYDLS